MMEGSEHHVFSVKGTYLVYIKQTGGVLKVSKPCYDVLKKMKEITAGWVQDSDIRGVLEKVKERLLPHYDEGVLDEVGGELLHLYREGILPSHNKFEGAHFRNAPLTTRSSTYGGEHEPIGVKALCVHPVHACNMVCRYCFADQGAFSGVHEWMREETARQAVDFLITQSGERQTLEIDFFGGEPLMNFPLIKKMVSYARSKEQRFDKRFKFTVTTNGLLLSDEIIDYLVSEDFAVVMSLDGRPDVHNNYRKDLNGQGTYSTVLDRCQAMIRRMNHKEYYIRGTYTRENLEFSHDVQHLAEVGFKRISLEPVISNPESSLSIQEDDLKKIKEEYIKIADLCYEWQEGPHPFDFFHFNISLEGGPCRQKRLSGCGAGFDYMAVDPSGRLFPCHQFVGRADYSIGHVESSNPGGFNRDVIWDLSQTNITTKEVCQKCWASNLCGGGCHANNLDATGTIRKPDPLGCDLKRMQFETALYLKAREL